MMYYLSYLSNMGFKRGGGGFKVTPPSISWFSSTPAGIGLSNKNKKSSNKLNLNSNSNLVWGRGRKQGGRTSSANSRLINR